MIVRWSTDQGPLERRKAFPVDGHPPAHGTAAYEAWYDTTLRAAVDDMYFCAKQQGYFVVKMLRCYTQPVRLIGAGQVDPETGSELRRPLWTLGADLTRHPVFPVEHQEPWGETQG